ncbi:hypothetical protein T492DRAFT_917873 [Pavlovales sp. CCMP2436]|nr:hypothetical protein T492DRAFT_917873 [Pavlovales sp. CCMP2436]
MMVLMQALLSINAIRKRDATFKGYRPVAIASAIHIVIQLPFAASVVVWLWLYRAYFLDTVKFWRM